MGVQLNIKDGETVDMARRLASRTGQSVTAAIKTALERELIAMNDERQRKLDAVNAIVDDIQKRLPPDWKGKTSREIMDEIYDEDGLPI